MYHSSLQRTILVIVPGKRKMCLQEILVNCADCGGLSLVPASSYCQTPVLGVGLGVDFTFAVDNNHNKDNNDNDNNDNNDNKNPHLIFLK